jgi:deoxyribonuclease IV
MKKKDILLGAHMSIEGGIQNAYYRAHEIGCTALQFFSHSNRQWAIKPISKATQEAVQEAQKKTGITHGVVHASYLINLAAGSNDVLEKSTHTLTMELEQCADLNIPFLVLHPGSNKDEVTGIKQIAELLNKIFAHSKSPTKILLENTAGQGTQVGHRLEHLAEIRKAVTEKKRVGYCIDTCHLWAAGYDFSNPDTYKDTWHTIDKVLGLTEINVMHMNDSKQGLGSQVDRHADIGKGTIGLEGFRLLMNDHRLAHVAKILETPSKELSAYAHNMKILVDLIK